MRRTLVVIAGLALMVAGCRTRLADLGSQPEDLRAQPDDMETACAPVDDCHVARIDPGPGPQAGQCLQAAAPDGTPCDDGDACTRTDRCRAGRCTGGDPVHCPGANAGCARANTCDPKDGTCGICSAWQPGWDEFAHPLDFDSSYVLVRTPKGTRDLRIHYHLEGAEPSTSHYVGLVLFLPTASCPGILGDVQNSTPCHLNPTRQGVTVPAVLGFDPAVIHLDGGGLGDADVAFLGVAPGSYHFALMVRIWGDSRDSCPNCNLIYQSPGPFGNTLTVTVQ